MAVLFGDRVVVEFFKPPGKTFDMRSISEKGLHDLSDVVRGIVEIITEARAFGSNLQMDKVFAGRSEPDVEACVSAERFGEFMQAAGDFMFFDFHMGVL